MKAYFPTFTLGAVTLVLAGAAIKLGAGLLELPVVKIDARTGKCIGVIAAVDSWSCENLPPKYTEEMILVKARPSMMDPPRVERFHRHQGETASVWGADGHYLPGGCHNKACEPVEPAPALPVPHAGATTWAPQELGAPLAAEDGDGGDTALAATPAPAAAGPQFVFIDHHHHTGRGATPAPLANAPIPHHRPASVPEPSSALLLLAAGAALIIRRMLP